MDKYQNGMCHKGSFCVGSNIDLSLIMCDGNSFILSKLQSYVLHWYHTYLLHPGMDKTKTTIHQYLYWPNIRDAVWKEVTYYDNCKRT